ncbi:hypothetical protein E2C01_049205 [Portunus trituberculatus]|uniref:Uncharacterized protein n=1 Tax=Portunus trituberculatus TaxID=210409 RepID=A0A5B7GFF7_PORTR|nr:hypothetical protein [Portunus trituberculatus]
MMASPMAPLFFHGAEGAWCGRHVFITLPSAVLSDVASGPPEVPIHSQFCLNQTDGVNLSAACLIRWPSVGLNRPPACTRSVLLE